MFEDLDEIFGTTSKGNDIEYVYEPIPWGTSWPGESNPFYGCKHTEETKKHLSESKKKTHNSPSFLAKHKARYANKGHRWLDPDGNLVIINTSMNEFCKKHGLNVGRMAQVAQQKPRCKSHKGWRPAPCLVD